MLLCNFLGQTLYTLHKRDQSKCKFFRLFSTQIKIHQILVIFETKNKFCTTLIVCIGVSTPPQKHLPLFLAKAPLKLTNCPNLPPFLGHPPLYIGFSWTSPLKVGSFSEPPVWILSYDREQYFCLWTFLSLDISDFNLFFYVKIATPPPPPSLLKKVIPLFPSNSPLKAEVPSSPPPPLFFQKFGWRLHPLQKRECTLWLFSIMRLNSTTLF